MAGTLAHIFEFPPAQSPQEGGPDPRDAQERPSSDEDHSAADRQKNMGIAKLLSKFPIEFLAKNNVTGGVWYWQETA
ncbi:hypothetical protein VSDG_07228 [Cytospora chrysosperma]|uniref:Uncharacterized protein n=1 Tax=Cytospora chrysosperma TaxID=252740 RepID=A0A423VMV6_CYTCH|nr:hypothetical protein VSDG_07228 [Valsa sordida]